MSTWSQTNFQQAGSSPMEEFIFFHDFANMILLFISLFVAGILYKMVANKIIHEGLVEGHLLECVWTILPGLVLIQLALPSLILLYALEDSNKYKSISLKAIGHQWYWSYNYPEYENVSNLENTSFDSYMLPTTELEPGDFRLLDVDNRITLPNFSPIRVLVTSADVLHSWTVPSMGVKTDATPGRLNLINMESHFSGVFYGQCSEICGANHSFMPIVVQFTDFKAWVSSLY